MINNITFKNVLKFTFPSISMMIFLSIYTMVDGIFVANLISTNALSALNILWPILAVFYGIGTMLGTGGNAICAKLLGEGHTQQAKEKFTLFCITALIAGFIFVVVTLALFQNILYVLGANAETYQFCYDYLIVITFFAPFGILQIVLENAMIASGRPKLAFIIIVLGGLTNLILDYAFIVYCHMGMQGVALATGLGFLLPTLMSGYFFYNKTTTSLLHFAKFKFDIKSIFAACTNGSSELVTHLSSAVTIFLFNIAILKIAGNAGVAAITVILYAQYLINTFFIGFSVGIAPVISFYFGALNRSKLRKLFYICLKFISISSIALVIVSYAINESIARIFLSRGTYAYELTVHGFYIFSIGFLFSGLNIFASNLFTAYSNGKVSAFISFLRTFVFITFCILILPKFMGINGIWLAVPIAEFLSCFMSVYFFRKYKGRYMYELKARIITRPCR